MGRLKDIEDVKEDVRRVSDGNLEITNYEHYNGNKSNVTFRRLDCGHSFERTVSNVVRVKVFSCPTCEPEKFARTYEGLENSLNSLGVELISAPNGCSDRSKVNIRLACGCEQVRQVGSLIVGGGKCKMHSEGFRSWQEREFYESKLMSLPFGSFEIVGIFQNAGREATYRCRACGHAESEIYHTIVGRGGKCKNCFGSVKSIREQYLAILLEDMGVEFVREMRVGGFRFDFYLPSYNTLIEYDGVQHIKEDGSTLFAVKNNDKQKDSIAKELGYVLLRIGHKESIINNVLQFLRKSNDYPFTGVDSSESKDRTPC